MLNLHGQMLSYGGGGLRLSTTQRKTSATSRCALQFKIFDLAAHNSDVFVRFPRPTLDLASDEFKRRAREEPSFEPGNAAWKAVIAGFEVQLDDNALGDSNKDFYGIRPEPNGLYKNRTGAIYKIQAGDRIWHQGTNEPVVQDYQPVPALTPGTWFEYEIAVQGDDYTVVLTDTDTGQRQRTTSFHNTDPERGRSRGLIGVQAYAGSTVAWRNIPDQARIAMLSWSTILYGACLSALGAIGLLLLINERRVAVVVLAAAAAAAGALAWNAILKDAGGGGFFIDASIAVFPVSWQDTGSAVFALAPGSTLLALGPLRSSAARQLITRALLAAAAALVVDVYLY